MRNRNPSPYICQIGKHLTVITHPTQAPLPSRYWPGDHRPIACSHINGPNRNQSFATIIAPKSLLICQLLSPITDTYPNQILQIRPRQRTIPSYELNPYIQGEVFWDCMPITTEWFIIDTNLGSRFAISLWASSGGGGKSAMSRGRGPAGWGGAGGRSSRNFALRPFILMYPSSSDWWPKLGLSTAVCPAPPPPTATRFPFSTSSNSDSTWSSSSRDFCTSSPLQQKRFILLTEKWHRFDKIFHVFIIIL